MWWWQPQVPWIRCVKLPIELRFAEESLLLHPSVLEPGLYLLVMQAEGAGEGQALSWGDVPLVPAGRNTLTQGEK